jgi:hypothetical protein
VHRASAIGRRISAESIAQASRPCRPDGRNENEAPESRGRPAGFSAPAILPGLPRKTLHRRFTHLKDRFIKRARLFSCAGSMIEPCLGEDSEGQAH